MADLAEARLGHSSPEAIQRAETLARALRYATTVVVFALTAMLVLAEIGVSVAPLLGAAGVAGQFDVTVRVNGGGLTGQADAVRMGLARAIVKNDEEARPAMRAKGLLTRDPRKVERKKPGRPGARKRFQFSKR